MRQAAAVNIIVSVLALTIAAQASLGSPPTQRLKPQRLAKSPTKLPVTAPTPVWRPRAPRGDSPTLPNLQGLADLSRWPEEPRSPATIDPEMFARAMRSLCPRAYGETGARMAPHIITWSRTFGVDAFTLGALTYWRSNCRTRFSDGVRGGVAALNHAMHARHLKDGVYTYHRLSGAEWKAHTMPLSEFGHWPGNLRRLEPAVYFAAAFLRLAELQCKDLDKATGSVAHRHPVSHIFWGDRVRGTDAEDRVLIARRRLLAAYGAWTEPTLKWGGLRIQSPLGGTPRKVTSDVGDKRDGGRRRHKGVDFASDRGEPVYAIADGIVAVAGPQMKRGVTPQISAAKALSIPKDQIAVGGLFVMIDHAEQKRSAYMHLDTYYVRRGERVHRGQIVGTVGRSGLTKAHAHLHFELRIHTSRTERDRHLLPLEVLKTLAIDPRETWRGRRLLRGAMHHRSHMPRLHNSVLSKFKPQLLDALSQISRNL